jgi:zinc transport system ATP-binding protein
MNMPNHPDIELRNVSFSYRGDTVLRDITLTVERGDFLAVIGPNGGGKSTLLKLMLGILHPVSGTVRVFGETPLQASTHIGYVPQDTSVGRDFPITALDVVMMGRLGFPKRFLRPTPSDREAARLSLQTVDMWEYRKRKIDDLSGGQRQRVFIARALASEPKILLLDEPTANIDFEGQRRVYEILRSLNERITVVVVSHDLDILLGYAKSVAHVNTTLHYHREPIMTPELHSQFRDLSIRHICPVELFGRTGIMKTAAHPEE